MSGFSADERMFARIVDGIVVAVLVAIATIAVLTFRDYGLGWDDYTHAEYGDLLLSLYGSGLRDQRAFSFVNLYMYGGGFDMLAGLAAKVLPIDLFETRRLIGAAIGLVGLLMSWRLGRRVAGPVAGLLTVILLSISPLYYGHMYMNPKDSPFAVAMVLVLLGLVNAFQEYPRPSPATTAMTGVGLGLAIGTRVIGLIAIPYVIAVLAFVYGIEIRRIGFKMASTRVGQFVLMLLPVLLLGYLVMGLVWPWSVLEPLNPLRAAEYFSHFFERPWKEMFDGAAVLVPDMPRSYVPTLFALKEPEITLLLALSGMAGAVLLVARGDVALGQRASLLLMVLAATLPVALTIVTRPPMYNGIRHFVFVTPPLAVLGGMAGAFVFNQISRYGRTAVAAVAAVLLAAVAAPAAEMIRLHPYQYTQFNHLAGGVQAAEERYMLDYWGLAFKQASEELREQLAEKHEIPPRGRKWRMAVCGPQRPAQVALGPDFTIDWRSHAADFAMTLGEFYCKGLNAPVLVEIKRDDVVYARVYDIRGRSIATLLSIPPP